MTKTKSKLTDNERERMSLFVALKRTTWAGIKNIKMLKNNFPVFRKHTIWKYSTFNRYMETDAFTIYYTKFASMDRSYYLLVAKSGNQYKVERLNFKLKNEPK